MLNPIAGLKAHTIVVEAKSREFAEKKMAEDFNAWMEKNPTAEIIHIFEPSRHNKTYGDYTYNTFHSEFTFFYREAGVIGRPLNEHEQPQMLPMRS